MTIQYPAVLADKISRHKHLLLAVLLTAGGAHAGDLSVTIEGLQGSFDRDTALRVAIYTASNFLKKSEIEKMIAPAAGKLVFQDLPAGRYAAAAYLDLNGNQKLDRNPFGIPLEPFAISNDAVGQMGPPSFDAAAFEVGTSARRCCITPHPGFC
ncbi:MAG: DUF2141 domain-containing protein [Pseudomonas sp.]|nr:MAG: DUF2141 domain-containing protein [Pseudomonas sp.]